MIKTLASLLKHIKGSLSPPVITRSPDEQQRIAQECSRLALYCYSSCPFCSRVERIIRQLGLDIEARNPQSSQDHAQTLIQGGGKSQVPCLHIREKDGSEQWIYESADIKHYLRQRFGADS